MMDIRNSVLICVFIGFCFLWTGSGDLTWLYNLMDFYPAGIVDVLTEVVGYIFQIIGLLAFSLYIRKKSKPLYNKMGSIFVIIADFCFVVLAGASANGPLTLLLGYCMNFFHGAVAGIYLTALVNYVSRQYRGRVFGFGYAIGSIGSWIISLPGDGNFLQSKYVFIVYFILMALALVIYLVTGDMEVSEMQETNENDCAGAGFIALAGITIFLISMVKSVGFYFPAADLSAGNVSLEFTRVFYAFGLALAGVIADKNRKYGAVCCVAALIFPFIMLALLDDVGASTWVWIFGYVFFGFFVVYRVLVFADPAGKGAYYLAGLGLMFGRMGDVAGTALGISMKAYSRVLVIITALLFVATIFVFFSFYQKMYFNQLPEEDAEKLLEAFGNRYELSPREKEVFRHIMEGGSNAEIAGKLYISENTVKFHVKNILKKTACSNRTELVTLYKKM